MLMTLAAMAADFNEKLVNYVQCALGPFCPNEQTVRQWIDHGCAEMALFLRRAEKQESKCFD